MNNTRNTVFTLIALICLCESAYAQKSSDVFNVSITDVSKEYKDRAARNKGNGCLPDDPFCSPNSGSGGACKPGDPTCMDPLPTLPTDPINPGSGTGSGGNSGTGCLPTDPWCGTLPDPGWGGGGGWPGGGGFGNGGGVVGTIFTLGQKVWDFILNNKPTAEYKTMRASVIPSGATNWAQLKGWSRPVSKVFRVEFKNIFGKVSGGFDYRIVFIYGGNFQGKGKYIGQISFAPLNIKLKTDRNLKVQAELLEPLNFGSDEEPVAGAQLIITWSSSTTLRYNMNSIEYFLYGTGELQDISNGT
ncbi:MAG: hypothetical protein JST80_01175 [Bdellovibrionales bacterium]|nr:hypothetical protein [Bdellovibrionales bacterium]